MLGKIGNVFHTRDIDAALEKGQNTVAANKMAPHSMAIDPGWGSSPFGIVITQWTDGRHTYCMQKNLSGPTLMKCYPKCRLL